MIPRSLVGKWRSETKIEGCGYLRAPPPVTAARRWMSSLRCQVLLLGFLAMIAWGIFLGHLSSLLGTEAEKRRLARVPVGNPCVPLTSASVGSLPKYHHHIRSFDPRPTSGKWHTPHPLQSLGACPGHVALLNFCHTPACHIFILLSLVLLVTLEWQLHIPLHFLM